MSSQPTPRAISQFSTLSSQFRNAERGYTLAALLVILTVIAVVVSFSVPRMWSDVMKREREIHTVFVMKQYAQAIADYERLKGGLPTKLEQLEKQTMPRVLRATYVNPLSGELDWILVPQGTVTPGQAQPVPGVPQGGLPGGLPASGTPAPGQTGTQGQDRQPPPNPREFSGPFIGVRPPQTGPSIIELNGQSTYENWMYTINELRAAQNPGGTGVVGTPRPN
ncbi:MAG: type II secretion system protein [Thermoanaerobaculia bacterium]